MNLNLIISICLFFAIFTTFSCQKEETTWGNYWEKGERLIQAREFVSAEKELKNALEKAEEFGKQDLRLPQTLTRLAAVYDAQSKWTQAEPLLERALKVHEKILGSEHPDLAISLRNLGALYHVLHKFDQGRPLFQRALWLRERHFGPDHPNVVTDFEKRRRFSCFPSPLSKSWALSHPYPGCPSSR